MSGKPLLFLLAVAHCSLIEEWEPFLEDQLLPWKRHGISEDLVNKTFDFHGSNIIYQYLDGRLYIYDPKGYCFCNTSVYGDRKIFSAHLRVCRALESILVATVKWRRLPNFELVWSLDDLPMWNIQTNITGIDDERARLENGLFHPGFGAIRCWSKGGLALPFLGSHRPWHIDLYERDLPQKSNWVPLSKRRGQLVFRGGPKGCSFWRNTELDFRYEWAFNWTRRDCGRFKLLKIAQQSSHLFNYTHEFLSMADQERIYRYSLAAEGFGGWADRLLAMMFGNNAVFLQDHPCDQWFEPLLRPWHHFVPVAHDFRDLTGTIVWANAHPRSVEMIIGNANQFADRYLRREGILAYTYTLLNLYSRQLTYQPRLRPGAIPSESLYDHARINEICQHIV